MSSETTHSSGRRSSRRGGRRSSRPQDGSRTRQDAPPVAPKKVTLWQKIVSFFGGGQPAAPAKPASSARSASSKSRFETPEAAPKRAEKPERPVGFRKPEIIEVTSARIYVGNLSFDATESDLSELFNGVGEVQNVEIVANKHTQKSKGFGFVQLQSVDEAKRAVAELHDKEYMGRKLVVSGAKALEEKRGERQRQPAQ